MCKGRFLVCYARKKILQRGS